MRKWLIKHVPQIIACLCCVACMAGVLCFGAFAQQEDNESYGGLTLSHSEIPFLSMDFAVGNTKSAWGVYRVPRWLADYRKYDFIIANGDSYRIKFNGDLNGYFNSPSGLHFEWRYLNRTLLSSSGDIQTYRYTQSMRLVGHDGYITTKTAQGYDQVRQGWFGVEWAVMYVDVEENAKTGFNTVVNVQPYRSEHFYSGDYLYQQAPIDVVYIHYNDVNDGGQVKVTELSLEFFLPSGATSTDWNDVSSADFDIRLTPLFDMINFMSSDLSGTDFTTNSLSIWNFSYLTNVMEVVYVPYYAQGESDGSTVGYENGYNVGKTDGYEQGYDNGLSTAKRGSFGDMIATIMDMMYRIFRSFFAYEVEIGGFTVNIIAWMGVLAVLGIAVFIVKKVWF